MLLSDTTRLLKVVNSKLIFTQNKQKYKFAIVYETGIYGRISLSYTGSARWQHFVDPRTDNIQRPTKSPDYLLDDVTQPSMSRLSEIKHVLFFTIFPFDQSRPNV